MEILLNLTKLSEIVLSVWFQLTGSFFPRVPSAVPLTVVSLMHCDRGPVGIHGDPFIARPLFGDEIWLLMGSHLVTPVGYRAY
ncbi:hypothetical protein ENUP19_0028G0003 [Entamoeba nuttalli]|uniref:Secreted protein n=1 Tax=Entamoeba nuttalli TaxID=412467 RepID=A0ABQ0D988_9EUKA